MGLITTVRAWRAKRATHRTDRLTARAAELKDDQPYDLLFLHQRGFVRAQGNGQTITRIHAAVENLIRKRLRVVVQPGTYLVASGSHQNMVTTAEYTFALSPCETHALWLDAACINADRPIPGKNDRFRGVAQVAEPVRRFLQASRGEDPMVIQAGVWTLTDGYSREAIISHLVSRDSKGNTWHPITVAHCERARAILDELGIAHRLWNSPVPYEKKTHQYDNGSYVGEFRHGDKHGRGTYTWNADPWKGDVYEGEWKNDRRTGQGTYVSPGKYKYVGGFLDNQRHGQGKMVYPDGSCYEGGWANGDCHGEGIYQGLHDYLYAGTFVEGKKHGIGKARFGDGGRYEGEWRNDQEHGQGKLSSRDGTSYEGSFAYGRFHGQGVFKGLRGYEYVGAYVNGKKCGLGKARFVNGSTYEGEWRDDQEHGQGIYRWPSGNRYEGANANGRASGGWLHYTNGTKKWVIQSAEGEWLEAEPPGTPDDPR